MRCRFRLGAACLIMVFVAPACGTPPHKEIDQAQGAIDAARAAGADRYASTEYAAAQTALKQANDAVTDRDYRLALNHALESREQAQNAARTAADTRARLRGDAERALAEVSSLIDQTRDQLGTLTPARARRGKQALTVYGGEVQKASKAIQAEDYEGAQRTLLGVKEKIRLMMAPPAGPGTTQSSRRKK